MGEDLKFIMFSLGNESYGVEVDHVNTIERMVPITRVPKTPSFIKGVINLRGSVLPIIDLRGRFGLEESEYTEQTRIIIVFIKDIEVGLIVDAANDVIDINSGSIESAPEVVGGIRAKYLHGIAKIDQDRVLVLLNLTEVLNKNEIVQLEEFEG
ncbi:chemotaxis protein CheW [Chengkuizengella axinellae]|uniref:Chemotaxis protein CheW n=1 Tax=Chengkuizengella axinellae TaxID=3064388 RepID=A0ABT9IVW2_9BACL|nr:chemotaxis protein CheW [Chengkuizengella sp. 2205SS18-9]MDP5273462.1 chemotaxis protein CheW [Chengkuizengella sp. 2205SS18-9]